jgi:hypothetical protein
MKTEKTEPFPKATQLYRSTHFLLKIANFFVGIIESLGDEIRKPFAHNKAKAKLENYEDEWRGRTYGHGDWVATEIGSVRRGKLTRLHN